MRVVVVGGYPLGPRFYANSPKYFQMTRGGVPVHIRELVNQLTTLPDFDIRVVALGSISGEFAVNGVPVHVVRYKTHLGVPNFGEIRRSIASHNPDIVHVQGTHYAYWIPAALADVPSTIHTIHGLFTDETDFLAGSHRLYSKLILAPLERLAMRLIPHAIVCSRYMQRRAEQIGARHTYVIPNGVDVQTKFLTSDDEGFRPYPVSEADHPTIFVIAVHTPSKGLDISIRVCGSLVEKYPRLKLFIAGDGPCTEQLQEIAQRVLPSRNYEFMGFVSEEVKYSFFRNASVTLFSSRYEPFGIAILEAMLAGAAIVAPRRGAIPEIVIDHETGLLFDLPDRKDLVGKITEILQDDALSRRLRRNAAQAAWQYSWERAAKTTKEVYEKILEVDQC